MKITIWGKLAGAATGFALGGGPLGALLGGLAGHFAYDHWAHGDDTPSKNEIAFTVGVIALGAKMAKADGVVTRDEVSAFRQVFKVPEDDIKNVSRLFDLAKQDVAGFESYAKQLAELMKDDADGKAMLQDVLCGLFHIAIADKILHPGEELYLQQVAHIFGFSATEFTYIKSRYVTGDGLNPYDVLEVSADISDDGLKQQYRNLVRANHPDKFIAARCSRRIYYNCNQEIAAYQ